MIHVASEFSGLAGFFYGVMKVVIVTGGAACGKSTFLRIFRGLNPSASFFSADEVVRELLGKPEVISSLRDYFGQEVINEDGQIDRSCVRRRVFSNEKDRLWMENLLHPLVRQEFRRQKGDHELRATSDASFIAEIPLYYETSVNFSADYVLVCAVSEATQLSRLRGRSVSEEVARALLASQHDLGDKARRADGVIWGEGGDAILKAQALELMKSLEAL